MNEVSSEVSIGEQKPTNLYFDETTGVYLLQQYPTSIELNNFSDVKNYLKFAGFRISPGEVPELKGALKQQQLELINLYIANEADRIGNSLSSVGISSDCQSGNAVDSVVSRCPEVAAYQDQVDFCSRTTKDLASFACHSQDWKLWEAQSLTKTSPHYPVMSFRLTEGLGQSSIMRCPTCVNQRPNLRERRQIYNDLLDRKVVEIDGYISVNEFVNTHRAEIEAYANERASSYENYLSALATHNTRGGSIKTRSAWRNSAEENYQHLIRLKAEVDARGYITQSVVRSPWFSNHSDSILITKIDQTPLGHTITYVDHNGRTKTSELPRFKHRMNDELGEFTLSDPTPMKSLAKRMFGSALSDKSFSQRREEYCRPLFAFNEGEASRLKDIWGIRHESALARILKYPFRLVYHSVGRTVAGRTVGAVGDLVRGSMADSIANPLMTVHNVAMDVGHLASAPIDSAFASTSRVQLCTTNLVYNFHGPNNTSAGVTALAQINPTLHVGLLMDNGYETRDELMSGSSGTLANVGNRRDKDCVSLSIRSNEPEPVILERLRCLNENFGGLMNYSFGMYNCGGYTKDIVEAAGLSYPVGINFGIGSVLGARDPATETAFRRAKEYCDTHMRLSRISIAALENQTMNEQLLTTLEQHLITTPSKRIYSPGPDLILQLVISTSKTNDPALRTRMVTLLDTLRDVAFTRDSDSTKEVMRALDERAFAGFFDQNNLIKVEMYPQLKTMFGEIKPSDRVFYQQYPAVMKLLTAFEATTLPQRTPTGKSAQRRRQ